jgi:hypothetical protein
MSVDPIVSKTLMPSDDVPQELLTLLAQLLRSQELPELAIAGAWRKFEGILSAWPGLAPTALESLVCLSLAWSTSERSAVRRTWSASRAARPVEQQQL